jgi:hypothetical protein
LYAVLFAIIRNNSRSFAFTYLIADFLEGAQTRLLAAILTRSFRNQHENSSQNLEAADIKDKTVQCGKYAQGYGILEIRTPEEVIEHD